jgi:hypothetical protein
MLSTTLEASKRSWLYLLPLLEYNGSNSANFVRRNTDLSTECGLSRLLEMAQLEIPGYGPIGTRREPDHLHNVGSNEYDFYCFLLPQSHYRVLCFHSLASNRDVC